MAGGPGVRTAAASTRRAAAATGGRRPIPWPAVAAAVAVTLPYLVLLVRVLAWSGPVYLSGDLAMVDLAVRNAAHFHQTLGAYDRFGWHHPGPAYFYLLAIPSWILGAGGRSEVVGTVVINGACALGVWWVVRRQTGTTASWWAAACLGLLGMALTSTGSTFATVQEPLGILASPWNPYVVVMPLVLCTVLCGAVAAGSPSFLIGAALTGSLAVQSDVSAFPLVAALLVGAGAVWAVRAVVASRRQSRHAGAAGPTPWAVVGVVALVAAWLPPLYQQVTGPHGNLALIVDFFTAHHVTQSWRMGLWAVAAVDRVLVLGRGSLPLALGRAPAGGLLVVLGVLALGGTAVVVGRRRRVPFAVFLGAVAVGGTAVAVVATTRVVGLLLNYLVIWALAVPVAALLGAVIAVVAPGPAPVVASPGRRGHVLAWVMAALALVAAAGFTLRQTQLPSPGHISDPVVAQIWRDVAPRLGPPGTPLHVNTAGVDLGREQTFIGLVALLELRGYHPKVNKAWLAVFGPASLWHGGRTSTRVFLAPYPQSDAGPGFVGRVGDTDVVVLRGT